MLERFPGKGAQGKDSWQSCIHLGGPPGLDKNKKVDKEIEGAAKYLTTMVGAVTGLCITGQKLTGKVVTGGGFGSTSAYCCLP